MSLTSYRAAPPRGGVVVSEDPAWWPGGDRLSRVLRRSTMGAGVFHGRVRDGNGCINPAMATGPPGRILGCGEAMIVLLCVVRGLALCAVDDCSSVRWC